ncbi:MAG: VOC family protein [Pseudomonadota bacterium]
MADTASGPPTWFDLTVADADAVRDFYASVCGWRAEPHDMGEYSDFTMHAPSGEAVTGICHARGVNAALPPVWIPYFRVPSLTEAVERAVAGGGTVLDHRPHPKAEDQGFAVISDPAGAVCAVWAKGPDQD